MRTLKSGTPVLRSAKATASAFAALSLIVLASGCSSQSAPTSTSPDSAAPTSAEASTSAEAGAPERSDADLVIWANGPFVEAMKPIADKFGEENGITVDVQTVATELQTNFVTANASGNGPDIVVGAHDWIGNFVQNSAIDPVQISAEQKEALVPVAAEAVTYNGQTYGMPYSIESLVLIRNTDLAPDAPSTVEEMIAAGQAAVDKGTAERAFNLQVGPKGDPYYMQPFYSSAGGYLFGQKPDGSFDPADLGVGKPGSVAAAQKMLDLGEKGSNVLTQSLTFDNSIAQFNEGKVPFMINGPWTLGDIRKAGINYALSPIPGFEGMDPAQPFTGVQTFYVASKGKNKSFAQTFLQTVVGEDETQRALYEAYGVPPASQKLLAEVSAEDADVKLTAEAASAGIPMPSLPEMAAVWAPLGQAEAAIVGGADPEKTMTEAGQTIASTLK